MELKVYKILLDANYGYVALCKKDYEECFIVILNSFNLPFKGKKRTVSSGSVINSSQFEQVLSISNDYFEDLFFSFQFNECLEEVNLSVNYSTIEWLEEICDNEDLAMNIARFYSVGENRDDEKSFYWFKQIADRYDNKLALMYTANAYETGEGVDVDIKMAIEYYTKALDSIELLSSAMNQWIDEICTFKKMKLTIYY